jgi:hypothetical protein
VDAALPRSAGIFPADQAEREEAWRKNMDQRLAKS